MRPGQPARQPTRSRADLSGPRSLPWVKWYGVDPAVQAPRLMSPSLQGESGSQDGAERAPSPAQSGALPGKSGPRSELGKPRFRGRAAGAGGRAQVRGRLIGREGCWGSLIGWRGGGAERVGSGAQKPVKEAERDLAPVRRIFPSQNDPASRLGTGHVVPRHGYAWGPSSRHSRAASSALFCTIFFP